MSKSTKVTVWEINESFFFPFSFALLTVKKKNKKKIILKPHDIDKVKI